jgi:hypothetical protein
MHEIGFVELCSAGFVEAGCNAMRVLCVDGPVWINKANQTVLQMLNCHINSVPVSPNFLLAQHPSLSIIIYRSHHGKRDQQHLQQC